MLAKLGQLTSVQRALLLLCLPVVLVSLLVIRAASSDQVASAPVPSNANDTAFAKKVEKQVEASSKNSSGKKRAGVRVGRDSKQHLSSPRAKAERRRSLTAYKDLSSHEARAAVSKNQPQIINQTAWKEPELQPGAKVLGYADTKTARIDMPGKAPDAFVSSTVEPIAAPAKDGTLKAIDLQLREKSDGLSPERSRVPLLLPDRASAGIEFGDGDSDQVGLSLGGSESRAVLVGDDKKVFYANTQVDTDTIVEALPLGAEISWTLRSPAAPASLPLNFNGPASDFNILIDGGASFDAGPLGDGVVRTPVAWDAQGRSVKTQLVVTEDGVSVEVDHRNADVAYPVVVDPAVDFGIRDTAGYNDDGTAKPLTNDNTLTAFSYQTSSPYRVAYGSYAEASGYVLFLRVTAGSTGNHHANLIYDAPRDSKIFRVTFLNAKHRYPKDTKLRAGIMNGGAQWESQYVSYGGGSWLPGAFLESAGWMDTATTLDACAAAGCGVGGSPDNKAVFQFLYNQVGTSPSGTNLPTAQTRGAYVYFTDTTAPSLDFGEFQNMPGTGWSKNPLNPKFRALVIDTGVGLGNANYYDSEDEPYHHASAFDSKVDGESALLGENGEGGVGPNCNGGIAGICPLTFEYPNYEVPLEDGNHTYDLTGADIVGNSTTHSYVIRTDREGPELDLSGRLGAFALDGLALGTAEPRTVVEQAPMAFTIKALDGRRKKPTGANAPVGDHRSGVKQLSAKLYGSNTVNGAPQINLSDLERDFDAGNSPAGPKLSNPAQCDPALAGNNMDVNNSCELSYDGTFDASTLDPGVYFFRVSALDYVGNLSQKDFVVAVGVASLDTVIEGQATARYVPIQVERKRDSATAATIQFRTAINQPWCNVDASIANGAPGPLAPENSPRNPVSNTVALGSDARSAKYVLDLDALRTLSSTCSLTGGSVRLPDGEVYVRAVMTTGAVAASARASEDVVIRYEHGGLGTENATSQFGPGSVDLVTGNFSMTETDVNVDTAKSDLTVTRAYNSRYYTKSGPLGPGWTLGVGGDAEESAFVGLYDNADMAIADANRYATVDAITGDGESLTFELTSTPNKYRAEAGAESFELVRIPDAADPARSSSFKIHDHKTGTVTTFKPTNEEDDPGYYELDEELRAGTNSATTYAYVDLIDLGSVVSYAFAPSAGLNCRGEDDPEGGASPKELFDALPRGCQALKFNYGSSGGGNRLKSISLKTWDPADSRMETPTVAEYSYDGSGRLTEAWDPRIVPNLKTTYGLLDDSRINSVTPAGEAAYLISYLKLPEEATYGRISSVTRFPAGQSVATWNLRYYVPTQGAGAPFDFSATEVGKWGQAHPPFIAAALFTPDQPPNGSPATNYDRASLTYMDPLGRETNTRAPGGRINTTEYDEWGAEIRSLTAENRARALAESTPAARLAAAQKWDTQNQYAAVPGSRDQRRHLTRSIGPEHQIRLESGSWVQARTANDFVYDEGSPTLGNSSKEPFDLVTTDKESALVGVTLHDSRTTKREYGATEAEWELRIPRLTTTDPNGLQIKEKVTLDADGRVTERFQPRSGSSDQPSTTKIVYYSAGVDSANPECGGRPEWLGLPCKKTPGSQPTTSGLPRLPVQTFTYNYLRQQLTANESVVDSNGSTKTRTSASTYDEAGRVLTTETTGDVGTAVTKVAHLYSSSTGREIQTRFVVGQQTVKNVIRTFDPVGRQTNYTDAEGHASSISYDILSRPSTMVNEKATRTHAYDAVTGDLTTVTDSVAGTFTGAYDADGRLVGTALPGGIIKSFTYDTTGAKTYVGYSRSTGCSSNCLMYQNAGIENAHGQYSGLLDDTTGQDSNLQYFDYDAAGRLTRVQDNRTTAGTTYCVQREYSLDADSNRLAKVTRPEAVGQCAQSGGTTKTNSYDAADRLTNSGYVYDAFGRITSAPPADTAGNDAFSASYYVNDLARSITQNGVTQTLALDPMMRMSVKTVTSGQSTTTESYAYTGDADSPAFTQKGTTWSRSIDGIAGADAVQDSASGVKLVIQNLRGDIVAQSTTAGVLSTFTRVDEFGVPKAALPAGAKYAFHGSKQRETLTAGGVVAMGVRLYQPEMGRFLQVDPVLGGTANPYEYPSDPINGADLDGRMSLKAFKVKFRLTMFSIHSTGWGALKRAKGIPKVVALYKKLKALTLEGLSCGAVFFIKDSYKEAKTGSFGTGLSFLGPYRIPDFDMKFSTSANLRSFKSAVESCAGIIPFNWVLHIFD